MYRTARYSDPVIKSLWKAFPALLQQDDMLDEEKAVNVVYLDFRNAFDNVAHSLLLE